MKCPFVQFATIAGCLFIFFTFSTQGVQAQSNHTVSFSGSTADFNAAEKISAAANNTDYYITFDANNLYLGAFRTSGTFGATDNFSVYLDTDPNSTPTSGLGTTSGQAYNGVTGTLPFTANYSVHAEQSTQEARSDAGAWASTISGVTYNTGSTWREVSVPFSSIGNPDALYITMWMGYSGGIYSNAPGADLGSGANPTVVNYIGGFGVSSVDCVPVNTVNSPITASLTNAVPASGITYGKITISSATITATNNFNIAAGGSIQITGGSFDISGRTINLAGSAGNGRGTTINHAGGTLTSSASTLLNMNGEVLISGSALTYDGQLQVRNKFTPLASGGTTIGGSASIDIRSGGYVNTNALTYSAGSTLMYNTGSTFIASTEWTAGANSGVGVPSNVIIGNNIANSILSFGASSSYRQANGNITVSNTTSGNGLTLSSASGGDLRLTGNFLQNGTFTHSQRAVTFNGSGAQTISGSLNTTGTSNNFRYLVIDNSSGGVTLNSNTLISGTSGDVLQLLNSGDLNVASGISATIEGNGGNILVSGGTRTINFNASSSTLNITGTKTVISSSSGLLNFTSTATNGTVRLSAAVNFGNSLTTIGNNTYLQIDSGGSVSTNAPTYGTGSTLVYNTGSTFTASIEWSTNSTSGTGVPSNVLIGNGSNTTLSFGTSGAYRHANGNMTVSASSGLTLSTVSGGDLQLRGNFAQNGTFTHSNRAVTFNGTGAQSITGSLNTAGTANNFAYLVINNTNGSGVTINNDVLVSQTTGDVLQLLNSGPLNIAATRVLTLAGTGGNIRVTGGTRTINFNASSSVMNITGSKTVASTTSGLLSFTSTAANGNLRIAAAVNFGGSLTTIGSDTYLQIDAGGSVTTNAPTYATGSTLVYNSGSVSTGTEWTANSTSAVGVPHHVLIGNGTNSTVTFSGATYRHANGNVGIVASSGLTLSATAGGNLQLRGDFSNSGTFTHSSRDVTFLGTSAQQQLTGASTFYNLILNNSNGLLLNSSITATNILTLTSGSITLGNNNITLSNTATGAITGTFSATRMIVTNGTGQLIRAITTATNYTFPVGETTGTTEYSPAFFNFSANGTARNIGVRVVDADHPQLNTTPTQTDYISRYWVTSNSAASTYTYTSTFTYLAADLNGAESNVRVNMWNGTAWTHMASSSSTSNVLTTGTGTNATLPLGATAEFTARVNNGTTYTWNQTGTSSWATAANWTPTRTTPAANDILLFNNGATTTATGIPTQTIGQLLISGNTTVTLQPAAAGNTLTIAGGNGTDFSIASGSTVNLTHATNQMTIEFANSTMASIAGTFGLTGDLANELDCTNSAVTVSGSINSFATIASTATNLSFTSTGNYRHNYTTTAGAIPVATWDVASTCTVQGITSAGAAPANLNQAFGNFTWNCTGQSNAVAFAGALNNIGGNFTVSSTGSSRIDLADAAATIYVAGNMTISGANTSVRLANSNGTYTATLNITGGYSQSTASSSLLLNNGNGNTVAKMYVGGAFNFAGGTISQPSGSTAGNLIEFNGSSAQAVTIAGTLPAAGTQVDYRVNNLAGITLTGTIPVRDQSTFYRTAGAITGGTISYNATGSTLVYEGTTAMTTGIEFPSSNGPEDLRLNTTNTITLAAARSLPSAGVYTNTSGVLALGAFDFTINNSAAAAIVNASPSATNMIAADGAGQLKRAIATGAVTYLFPIGDITGTPQYSGASMQFTANSVARILGFRVSDAYNANDSTALLPSIDYTSRTWYTTLSVTTGTYTYTPTLYYNAAGDVYGTENNMLVSNWTGAAWASRASLVTAGSPTSTIATTSSVTQATLSLNAGEIMGRAPVKYWTGNTNNQWSTAGNWVPSGVPGSTDNIDISFYTNFPCVLSSGSVSINHLTLSGTGDFTLSSGASLTVAGNFTYDNPASAVFSCGSTLVLSNSVYPQTVPAVNFGSLNVAGGTRILASSGTIGICNSYTPTAGTLTTTGSLVNFNGTSAQSILTNSTSFNNVIDSNTSGTVSSANNVAVSGNMTINAGARFNNSGGTLTINSGASADVFGYLRNAATVTPTGTLTFKSGGTYEHNTTTPGTIPNSTWDTGSTCELIGSFSDGNLNCQDQAFYNFKVNYGGTGDVDCNGTLGTINGDFICVDTGGDFIFASADVTIDIAGSFTQSDGSIFVSDGNNNNVVLNIAGDFSQTSGAIDMATGNSNASGDVFITGNFSRTGDGTLTTSGNASNGVFNFVGTTQTITETSSGENKWMDYDIESGSTTTLLSNMLIEGTGSYIATFDINSGGKLDCGATYYIYGPDDTWLRVQSGGIICSGNTAGINTSGSTGSVQTVTRSYSSGGTYVFNGTTNQSTGTFWTSTTPTTYTASNLTINNTGSSGNNTVTSGAGADINVTTLSFPSTNLGALDVTTNKIKVNNSSTAAVSRLGQGHVIGQLQRTIATGVNTYVFDVGTAGAYSPASIAYNTVSNSGYAIVRATAGPHPNASTDGLSQSRYLNRYWTIANSGITSTGTATVNTFSYPAADLVGGATSSSLQIARWSGSSWTYPTSSTATNQISASALSNSTTYGDFFAADCSSFVVSVTPSSATICNGGSVGLVASSNFGSPTYAWTGGTGLNTSSGASVTASPTTTQTYTVTATTATNCVADTTVTVTVNPRPTGAISGTQNLCNGSSATLSIAVTGTGPWSGTLSSGASFSGSSTPITVSVSPSTNTTYTIATLVDANCTAASGDKTGSAIVTVKARPTGAISGTQNLCQGSSATLSIAVTGTGPWSGTLSDGTVFSGSSSPISVSVSPSSNTTYTIATLIDANCTAQAGDKTGSAIVSVNARPTGAISGTTTICNGSSASLSINVTGTGPWSGTLSGGTVFSGSSSPISVSVSPSSNTTYTIATLVDANCTAQAADKTGSAVVSVNARPTGAISGTTTICNGSSAALSINVTGTGPWSGTLSGGTVFSGSSTPISVSVSPSSNTTYTIATLVDANCTAQAGDKTGSAVVSVNARPTGAISGTTTICNGSSATLSIAVTGTGPWSGTLSGGTVFSGSSSPISVSVSPSSNTTYTIATLVDANCTAQAGDKTGSAVVSANARPTGVISGTTTICNGSSATLSIAVTGTGPWSGTLSGGTVFSGSSSPISVSVSPSSNTTYTIATLVDANCTASGADLSGSAVITLNVRPTAIIGGSQSICAGSSAPIFINVTGTGTISGTLSPGAIAFSGTAPTIFLSVSPGSNTTYTVATLSDANCSAISGDLSGSAAIIINPLPTAGISGTTSVCSGSSSTISFTGTANAVITYTINGGPAQTITLNGGGTATLNSGAVVSTKTYALVSVNDGNCSASASGLAVLTPLDLPESDITGTTSICGGSSTTISFSGNAGAIATYTINGGSNQFITLNGSGLASFNTGALSVTTTYLLVSVSDGTCSQNIGMSAVVTITGATYYQDSDSDGFGNPSVSIVSCTAPVGYVSDNTDCCDSNADINPLTEWWADVDSDGYGGFVYDNGCLAGVTCSSGTWPAQTIPYYPAAHGGASYVLDCNDNAPSIHPGATEICANSVDDNCNGVINEGCGVVPNDNWTNAIAVNVVNPNAFYPNCVSYTGTLVNSTVSPQGNISNVVPGAGKDVWYKFTANSTGVQIKVTPSGFDAVVELQNSSAIQQDAENINNAVGGLEILNFNGLTVGQTYWVAIRNHDVSAGGSFALCVSPLMPSGCSFANPVGGFSLCSNFKAVYRGATSYTFSFTGSGGAAAFPFTTHSVTTNGLVPMATPSLDLRYNGVYNVRVDANYASLVDGLGNAETPITVLGNIASTNCTGVTIMNQPLIEVKASQRCPASVVRSNYLIGTPVGSDPMPCSAISYTYEFTQVSDCSGSTIIGIPFTVTTSGNTPYLLLSAAFPSPSYPLPNLGSWKVRIRPNFTYVNGIFGPAQIINVNNTSASQMLSEQGMIDAERSVEAHIESGIYPNPNNGNLLNINLTGLEEGNVYVKILDALGRTVYTNMYTAEGTLNTVVLFERPLDSGLYVVEFTIDEEVITEKMIVEK